MVGKIYSPLHEERNEIRIVTLHPQRQGDDSVYCSLRHMSLDEIDPEFFEQAKDRENELRNDLRFYEALSYTWGVPTRQDIIQLNDQAFNVTHNLWQALHDLRVAANELGQGRQLWAEAICINQKDNEEKSRQIPRMSKIYNTAMRVLVWLGPGTRESQWVLDLLEVTGNDGSEKDYLVDDSIMAYGPRP